MFAKGSEEQGLLRALFCMQAEGLKPQRLPIFLSDRVVQPDDTSDSNSFHKTFGNYLKHTPIVTTHTGTL